MNYDKSTRSLNYSDKKLAHAKDVWEDYENGKSYQSTIGLTNNLPLFVKFYQGDQWAKPTEDTMDMPRPIANFIELIVDNKVSNVLGTPVKYNYIGENQEDTSKFTRFASWQTKDMGLPDLNDRACIDGAVKGTYVFHIYFDDKAKGRKGSYEGAVRGQIIDPLNLIVANPSITDEQKQKWIIIVSREEVGAVKKMADKNVDKSLIVPDDNESEYYEEEQEAIENDSKLCTVLTRYFRKNGEVYFEKIVKDTIIHEPRPINPQVSYNILNANKNIDTSIASSPDEDLEREINRYKAWYYPVVVGSWKKRDKCIYGRGEVEGIIPNQKIVNFLIAMQTLNIQESGWGKLIVKQNALNGQEITNAPGQVITDYTNGSGWGITRLDGSQINSSGTAFVSTIIDLTRACTNSSEVITGEMIGKDLSGTAIAQLQAQSQKPIARLQKNFWKSQERLGKILEQFYKLFYEDTAFTYDLEPDELQLKEEAMGIGAKIQKTQLDVFNGSDYVNQEFAVVCEVGAGTQYSEIMSMDTLNNLFLNGAIKNMSTEQLEQYMTLMPDSAMPFKSELKAIIRKQQQSELVQYKQIAEQQAQENEQLKAYSVQQEEVIKNLHSQVKELQNFVQTQETQYKEKISKSNEIVGRMLSSIIPNKNKEKNQEVPTDTKEVNKGNSSPSET